MFAVRQLSLTAILFSLLVSLTTTPCMCAHLMKHHEAEKHGVLFRLSERGFERLLAWYRHSLLWALDNSVLMLAILLLMIALNAVLIVKIPKGFFPRQDTGALVGGMQGPQDASFPVMNASVKSVIQVIRKDPAVQNVEGYVGQGNGGFVYVALKPLNQRKISADDVINRLRPKLNRLPIATTYLQAAQDLRIGGRGSNALYQYTLQSDNVDDLSHWGPILLNNMRPLPGFQDVNTDQQNGGLDEKLTFDRTMMARMGLTSQAVDTALYDAFGQAEVSIVYTRLNQYYVVMEVAPQYWQSPAGLNYTFPAASSNGAVPLNAVTTTRDSTTPIVVNHTGLFPSVTVSFNLAPGVSLSDATQEITEMQNRLGMPQTIRGFFSGTLQVAYQQSLSTSSRFWLRPLLLAVFIVLGMLYAEPGPSADRSSPRCPRPAWGAMALALANGLRPGPANVISIIGIVLLIGLVKKNAIMMIDFALAAEREDGMSTKDAIFEACLLRFRPIMMTTMAALFGALPLAFLNGQPARSCGGR